MRGKVNSRAAQNWPISGPMVFLWLSFWQFIVTSFTHQLHFWYLQAIADSTVICAFTSIINYQNVIFLHATATATDVRYSRPRHSRVLLLRHRGECIHIIIVKYWLCNLHSSRFGIIPTIDACQWRPSCSNPQTRCRMRREYPLAWSGGAVTMTTAMRTPRRRRGGGGGGREQRGRSGGGRKWGGGRVFRGVQQGNGW